MLATEVLAIFGANWICLGLFGTGSGVVLSLLGQALGLFCGWSRVGVGWAWADWFWFRAGLRGSGGLGMRVGSRISFRVSSGSGLMAWFLG